MKRVKFGVSGHILESAWREWPEILHADVSWPPSELISSGSQSVRPSVRPSVRLSVRPSGDVSGHLPENAWRDWPEILHADVSWPSSELISLWPRSVDFFLFWRYFDLVKRVKFGVSGHFPENAWRKWPEILHADVSWAPSELISLWPRSVDFSNFGTILT